MLTWWIYWIPYEMSVSSYYDMNVRYRVRGLWKTFLVDIFLKKVDNASLQRYGPTYAYILFLTRRDSLEQETFHESLEFFLNFQDADIFHFVKDRIAFMVSHVSHDM